MKRILSFLLVSALCLCFVVPSFAAETVPQQNNKTIVSVSEKDLGNGFTMRTVISIPKTGKSIHSNTSTQTKTASATSTVRHDGTWVGSITLTANFGYNRSSAWVNRMSTSHRIASGWTYKNERTWKSGGTANMSASMSKKLGFIPITTVDPSVSITCSPTGQIS